MVVALDCWSDPVTAPEWADDGESVLVRPVRAQDGPLIDAFVKDLSPISRLRRFHAGIKELSPAWLDRMTHPDMRFELALIAVLNRAGRETCIGEARYAVGGETPGEREFALVVADAWQRVGIGACLLRILTCHAERCGVARLYGDVLRDNVPMLALARRHGYEVRRHPTEARLLRVVKALVGSVDNGAALLSTDVRPDVPGTAATQSMSMQHRQRRAGALPRGRPFHL
jgi:acetyltransferase